MENTKTETVVFTNYKSDEDLSIGTRTIKTAEFHKSELEKIPLELLDHQELENVIFNDCRFTHVENLEQLKVCQNITNLTLKKCNLQTFPEFLSEFHTLDSLNLSGNSFQKGSLDSMTKLRRLECLDLSRCTLQEFPLALTTLRRLKTLNIEKNDRVCHLSESLENLTNVETLNMSCCGLTEFPQVLCRLESLKTLDIGWNKNIRNLPSTLENLTNVETLNISNCGLTEFPQVLCKLKSLKTLDIGENENIRNLPNTLENLTNLETLKMYNCGLTEFPQVLCKLKSLKTLVIGENENIRNLPSTLENLTNLETLDMWHCGLTEFPQVLCKLKSLKTLEIGENENIPNLPNTLENLTNLETLDMWHCGLTEFPQVLCKLKSLKTLNIRENGKIRNLPNTLENLTNLETLDMWHCGLTEFPQVLCKLKSLKTLDIGWNKNIANLPNTLENLTNLETLYMWLCGLTEFPQVLCRLKSLKTLDIGRNENIRNLPNTLENLTNLETLDMWHCGLTEFPQVLFKLKSLKTLDIKENENIRNLPNTTENLTNLETLNIRYCSLTEFPQVLCRLKSLKTLDIGGNKKIQNLPDTLENLTHLETLNISECGLTEFPQVLCKLKSLKILDIGGNKKIQNLPDTLENLTNLGALNMQHCGLTEFPQVLCKLKSLKELQVRWFDNIGSLQRTLDNLTNLETLSMSSQGQTEFPKILCELSSLKTLHIDYQFEENDRIQKLIGTLESLTHLENLSLRRCDLKEFPQDLCKLKSLKVLNIAGNDKIQYLPSALEDLTNVEILDLSRCGLSEFPQTLCKLKSLQNLCISSNPLKELPSFIFEMKRLHELDISSTSITHLPKTIERCESLKLLDISYSLIKEFPTVIFEMKNLSSVVATGVKIEVLDEDFVKLWSQTPEIFTGGRFQKMVGRHIVNLWKPPNKIVQRGPKACRKYYTALRADDAVNCSILNVTVMGKTGVGKSSLTHSIKEGSSVLIHPSDRTVVVDSLEVKQEDVLLKIADFGGHDIYEMTCPLFLKSTKQVAIVAVKLQEYSENSHSELVSKWLTSAASNMTSGKICIVATQCDLCGENEVKEKMRILEREADSWLEEEFSFAKKMTLWKSTSAQRSSSVDKNIQYFQTSSLSMEGVKDVQNFLFREAKSNISELPERWADVYKKMDEQIERSINFITMAQYKTLFRKCMAFPRNLVPNTEESLLCLQFLHDSGLVLWFGEKCDNLRDLVFHDPSFLMSLLQCLFRHDLAEVLHYDHEQHGQYIFLKSKFQEEVISFTQTGILNPLLLRCIWNKFDFRQEIFDTMVEMLTMLDLCYKDGKSPENRLRLPWFVQDENMNFLEDLWPEKLPPSTLQYTLTYCFCHRIPGVIYERFCVRLQRHLQTGGHTRQDRRHAVYIEQNTVQILFQRHPVEFEPNMQIHLRCSIDNLLQLQKLCLALHKDMDNLCMEYSGLYIDCYLLCPHCLLTGSTNPTKRSATTVDEKVSLQWVPCDPSTPGSVQIPAALIFLRLFGSFSSVYFT